MERIINSDMDEWDDLSEEILDMLGSRGFPRGEVISFIAGLEEIFANISSYAYQGETGPVEIKLTLSGRKATMVFIDSGVRFDPLSVKPPDIHEDIKKRKSGGLGIHIARTKMDEMFYEYKNSRNILTVVKSFNGGNNYDR